MMKIFEYIRIKLVSILMATLIMWSCSDDVLNEIDTDPDVANFDQAQVSSILPLAIERVVFNINGGISAVASSTFAEQTINGASNSLEQEFSAELPWVNLYSALKDQQIIIQKSEENGDLAFLGIAQIMQAYTLEIATSLYGDIPYTEAIQSNENQSPAVDSQESLYVIIQQLLDDAIQNLTTNGGVDPGSSDVIYGGDLSSWIATAHGLKARYANRLSNIDPQGSADLALAAIASSFSSNAEGFVYDSYDADGNRNPLSQAQNTQNPFVISQTILDVMNSFTTNDTIIDPRAEDWFTKVNDGFVGALNEVEITDINNFSLPTGTFLFDGASQPLLLYYELKFIEAEAQLRKGNADAANIAYEAALLAGFEQAGFEQSRVDDYINDTNAFPGASNLTLQDIIHQKFIFSLIYQSIEAYNDYRRTGLPLLETSEPNNRFPIPNIETNANSNIDTEDYGTVKSAESKVWWAL